MDTNQITSTPTHIHTYYVTSSVSCSLQLDYRDCSINNVNPEERKGWVSIFCFPFFLIP